MTTHTCARPRCHRPPHVAGRGLCETHARQMGRLRPMVPHSVARLLVQTKRDEGWSLYALAAEVGITRQGLERFWRDETPMRMGTFEAILSVGEPARRVEGWRITRRVRALRAAGKKAQDIAAGVGCDVTTVYKVSNHPRQSMDRDLAQRFIDYYALHHADPVTQPDWRVSQKLWPMPFDWDDIDDPDEARSLRRPAWGVVA